MKKLVNNEYVEMTPEEISEFEKRQEELNALPKIPTDKDRIVTLENALADLAVMLVGGVNND